MKLDKRKHETASVNDRSRSGRVHATSRQQERYGTDTGVAGEIGRIP